MNDKDVSPFLKRVVRAYSGQYDPARDKCLDAPSGSGRNTFFLAQYFNQVLAVDMDGGALNRITRSKETSGIMVQTADLEAPLDLDLLSFRFICVVHFFSVPFLEVLLKGMRARAFLLIETPECHGENFRSLPTQDEITQLLRGTELLEYQFKRCKHSANVEGRGAVKAFLRII